jgi:hypothetical protein
MKSTRRLATVFAVALATVYSNSPAESAKKTTNRPKPKQTRTRRPVPTATSTTSTTFAPAVTTAPIPTVAPTLKPTEWLAIGSVVEVPPRTEALGNGTAIVVHPQFKTAVDVSLGFLSLADGSRSEPLADVAIAVGSIEHVANGDGTVIAFRTKVGATPTRARQVVYNRVTKDVFDLHGVGVTATLPRLSYDGSTVAFTTSRFDANREVVYDASAKKLPGGIAEPVWVRTDGTPLRPRPDLSAMSSDGRKILLYSINNGDPEHAFLRDLDSKVTIDLSLPSKGSYSSPKALSGDGQTVAVAVNDQPYGGSVWLTNLGTGMQRQLRDSTGKIAIVGERGFPLSFDGRSGLLPAYENSAGNGTQGVRWTGLEFFDEKGTVRLPIDFSLLGGDFEIQRISSSRDLKLVIICAQTNSGGEERCLAYRRA